MCFKSEIVIGNSCKTHGMICDCTHCNPCKTHGMFCDCTLCNPCKMHGMFCDAEMNIPSVLQVCKWAQNTLWKYRNPFHEFLTRIFFTKNRKSLVGYVLLRSKMRSPLSFVCLQFGNIPFPLGWLSLCSSLRGTYSFKGGFGRLGRKKSLDQIASEA